MGNGCHLASDIGQQEPVGGVKLLAAPTLRYLKFANLLTLIDQGEYFERRRYPSSFRLNLSLIFDLKRYRNIRELEHLGDRFDQTWKDLIGYDGFFQVRSQLGQDRNRLIAPAIHEPVDTALEPVAQWLE